VLRYVMKRAVIRAAVTLGAFVLLVPAVLFAGTTGKVSGRVTDKQNRPVVAATVLIVGGRMGAFTDAQGDYSILNVPPGTYEISIGRMGYKTRVTKNVIVSADNTTKLDAVLEESALATEEVVVTAARPPVEVGLTSTRTTLTSREIEALPVQELQDIVNLQAGVVDGHFRGGRAGEVQYQVDGVSVNNAFNNASSLRVDRSLLQEVQVISGTFDAEYGQAMSGVVNAVLKEGTRRFDWSGEAFSGGFVFPGSGSRRNADDTIRPTAIQNYQLTVSGPVAVPSTVYLLSGRRYTFDDYVRGIRRFVPTDSSDFESKVFHPTGDNEEMSLGYTREWSGVLKVTNTSIPDNKLSYQALVNNVEGRRNNFAFRLNPDGLSKQKTFAIVHGLDWTHTASPTTYLDLSLRQNYLRYSDRAHHNVYDPGYDAAGPPIQDSSYETGAFIQGVEFTRYVQTTNTFLVKGSVVSQVRKDHQVKVGTEVSWPKVSFGAPGYLTYTTVEGEQRLVRHDNEPPDYPGVVSYHPLTAALYAQDQIEWTDLTLRGGVRFEFFDSRAKVPSDLANPANSIAGAPPSTLVSATQKAVLAPRLGVAYPITERAAVHFAYGHFYQFPPIGTIFDNANYEVLSRLQAGGISYGVLGNPDVKPEKTVQYEFGYKHAVTDDIGVDVTAFYKDIRDLLGVEFITTYNDAEYARLTNVDFGSVLGFTVTLDDRKLGPASVAVDYTWQLAQGNSSDPRETATRASAGEDPRPRQVPFNWDQRHTVNMTVSLAEPDVYTASAVLRVASGQPYTPILDAGFGGGLEANSGRKPAGAVIDLRGEKYLKAGRVNVSLFGRVFNLLDARFFNGGVFASTGSPYYSRFPVTDEVSLKDPTRFYAPRRIEIGVTVSPGERKTADGE
jgi:outer membrane receptor protein involved in Fe transport